MRLGHKLKWYIWISFIFYVEDIDHCESIIGSDNTEFASEWLGKRVSIHGRKVFLIAEYEWLVS